MYNILLDAHLANTTSGIDGFSHIELSRDVLEALPPKEYEVTVASGRNLGVYSSMGMDMVCEKAKIYCDSQVSTSGVALFVYSEFVGTSWNSHGDYNYNTDYSTPIMQSNVSPDPYSCEATTKWSDTYKAYKAFNQTAATSEDCWHSEFGGAPPQSIMFYFPYYKVINKFAMQARNHANDTSRNFPGSFVIQGNVVDNPSVSNDAHWTTLGSWSGVPDPGQAGWSGYFTFDNITAYRYYRLKVTYTHGGNNNVSVANLKLIEANRPESVSTYESYENNMEWDGNGYVYTFDSPVGIEKASFYLGTTSGTVTVSGLDLLVTDSVVSVSGTVASGVYVDNYVLTHRTLTPLILNIRNRMEGWGEPNVLFNFTGVFDIDRNIFISPDYARVYDKDEATWYGLDYGYTVPELDTFDRGVLVDTKVEERKVLLEDDKTEGSWRSPVIDTNNKAAAAYVYTQGDTDVYVRASDSPPPLVNFLIVTTDNTHRWLMYDHKRVYIDSSGQVIGSNECDPPADGSKIWRWADHDWTATDLMYHGSINERGAACFVAPGYLECADISAQQEWEMPEYWYNFALCKLEDDSEWQVGTTISGLPYGEGVSVVMTKTFPIEGSDGFFCFSITSDENVGVSSVNLSFHQDGYTRGSYPLLNMAGTVSPSARVDVAYDEANSGWWVYLGSSLYKVDPGSINNIRIFNRPQVTISGGHLISKPTPDTMQGYIWKVDANPTWKGLVSIPSQDYSYFWAYGEKKIYLYEEKYQLNEPELVLHATIDQGVQVDSGFLEFHQGCCDSSGNLWMLDMSQERVIRVSLQKALLTGDERAVEYENQIAGVIGVWAHPEDGTCFLLITDEPEHPNQDIIRMVHVNQRWGSQGKYVCSVPGFHSKPYKYGVHFVGKSFSEGVRPHNNDDRWGLTRLDPAGDNNDSTEYATPPMEGPTAPVPFRVITTSHSTYPGYHAFNQHTLPEGDVNEGRNAWQASYIGLDTPSIAFVFDERKVINKYALAVYWIDYNATTGLIRYGPSQFPSEWELYGLKHEYEDSFSVFEDSQWDLLDYRDMYAAGIPVPMGYVYGDANTYFPLEEWNPWTPYFTFVNVTPRLAYRFKSLTLQYSGGAGSTSDYACVGQIKFVEAQELLPWTRYTTGRSLPRGRYKQVRVDMSRENTEQSSPTVNRVRVPKPVVLPPVPKGQDIDMALKTTFNNVKTPGSWDTKLRVWWYDEEI